MIHTQRWMYPAVIDKDGILHCEFFTANGKRHSIICRWNRKRQAFTFRFRGVLWAYKP